MMSLNLKKRNQLFLFIGMGLLVMASFPATFSLYKMQKTMKDRRAALEIQVKLGSFEQKIGKWMMQNLISERKLSSKELFNEELEKEVLSFYSGLERDFIDDPGQLKRIDQLKSNWTALFNNSDGYRSLEKFEDIMADIEKNQWDKIYYFMPLMDKNFQYLYLATGILIFLSLFLVGFSLVSMNRENKERKALLAKLEISEKEAVAASKLKSKFLATVSHEIRTPLNGIIGMSDIMRQKPGSAKNKNDLQIIHSSGKTLLRIVNDILDFSKIEADSLNLEESSFSIGDILNQVEHTLKNQADKKGLGLKYSIDPNLPGRVLGDSDRLAQVLFNLVGNAVKFTHKGDIEIKVSPSATDKDKILFIVEDTGVGMNSDELSRLFTPFLQFKSSVGHHEPGTGLGLSISKYLVEAMGGNIKVESFPGLGSRFWFEITLKRDGEELINFNEKKKVKLGKQKDGFENAQIEGLKILLVEDNSTNQIVIHSMLSQFGAQTILASNGKEALEILAKESVDLVLMDCQMPVMNGLEAAKELKKTGFTAPIVALTANASPEDRLACKKAGMDDFLSKPVTLKSLQEKVRSVASGPLFCEATLAGLELEVGEATMEKVLNIFISGLIELKFQGRSLLEQKDLQGLNRLGHKFKSSSLTVGSKKLAAVCAALEESSTLEECALLLEKMEKLAGPLGRLLNKRMASKKGLNESVQA